MGCGADVWEEFQRRFHIPQILEFYAATEGNFSLYNCEGRIGAIGRIPSFLAHRLIDGAGQVRSRAGRADTQRRWFLHPLFDTTKRARRLARSRRWIKCRRAGSKAIRIRAATEKKILRDVFANGDAWFRTGDLMRT